MDGQPAQAAYYQTPNSFADRLMHLLEPTEWVVLSYVCRHILGWQEKAPSRTGSLAVRTIEHGFTASRTGEHYHGCGLSKPTIISALDSLVTFKVLLKVGNPTRDGQKYKIPDDDTEVDYSALNIRLELKHKKNQKRTKSARSSGQSDLPLAVNPIDQQRSVPLTSSGQSDLPNHRNIKETTNTLQSSIQSSIGVPQDDSTVPPQASTLSATPPAAPAIAKFATPDQSADVSKMAAPQSSIGEIPPPVAAGSPNGFNRAEFGAVLKAAEMKQVADQPTPAPIVAKSFQRGDPVWYEYKQRGYGPQPLRIKAVVLGVGKKVRIGYPHADGHVVRKEVSAATLSTRYRDVDETWERDALEPVKRAPNLAYDAIAKYMFKLDKTPSGGAIGNMINAIKSGLDEKYHATLGEDLTNAFAWWTSKPIPNSHTGETYNAPASALKVCRMLAEWREAGSPARASPNQPVWGQVPDPDNPGFYKFGWVVKESA